jgi:hypothetical protein
MDLGAVQSFLDPEWRARVDNRLCSRSSGYGSRKPVLVHYKPGSIMRAFETYERCEIESTFSHMRSSLPTEGPRWFA